MSKFSEAIKKIAKQPWFETLKRVAPTVAGGLVGGPFAGVAVSVLQSVLGVTGDPSDPGTVDQIAAQIGGQNPEVLLKLKQAEQQFLLEMEKLDIQEQDLYLVDTQSARGMHIAQREATPSVLTYLSLVVFFGMMALILWQHDWFGDNEFAQNLCFMVIGGALGWVNQSFNFWLGSSRGSQAKSEAMLSQLNQSTDN